MTTLGRIDNQPIIPSSSSANTVGGNGSGIISHLTPASSASSTSSLHRLGNQGGYGSVGNGGNNNNNSSNSQDNRHRSPSIASSISVSSASTSTSSKLPDYDELHEPPPSMIPSSPRPYLLMFAFWFISFGYMLPWTGLGSLISYYKYTYSAHFYVEIYCAYYLLGLPVALLQYKFDEYIDLKVGSQNAFLVRGVVCYCLLILVQFTLLYVDAKTWMIVLFSFLGLASWWLHGTASMLVSMFPKALIAYLQIGFRSPEIYTVIADSVLSLGSDATDAHIAIFFKINCVILLFALLNWIVTVNSSTATRYFEEKDDRIKLHHERNLSSYTSVDSDDEHSSRRQGRRRSADAEEDDEENVNEATSLMSQYVDEDEWCAVKPPGSRPASGTQTPLASSSVHGGSNTNLATAETNTNTTSTMTYNSLLPRGSSSSSIVIVSDASPSHANANVSADAIAKRSPRISSKSITKSKRDRVMSDSNIKHVDDGSTTDMNSTGSSSKKKGFWWRCWRDMNKSCSRSSYNMLHYFFVGEKKKKGNGGSSTSSRFGHVNEEKIFNEVFPLCCTLMITMWCSIFQASFYAYVDSKRDWDIEQVLYFTRLFCDLIGRPLTFLPRPKLFQSTNGLFNFAVVRAVSMFIFFAYAFIPGFPQSDIFIIIYVGLFSLASGYVSVLTYEYAAGDDLTTAERAHATNILNMCFQIAAFSAVAMSVAFTADLW